MGKVYKKNKMINKRIKILRKRFNDHNIDGYIIPKNDEFFSEYANKDRLKIISNFDGSAGFAIILKKKNYLFVDGRYTIQAKQQCGKYFNIIENQNFLSKKILKNLTLGFDPNLFTEKDIASPSFFSSKLKAISNNLIDEIYKKILIKRKKFYSLHKKYTGESHQSKINKVSKIIKFEKADYLFISAPENVAWLMNIRGFDNPNSPIPNCQLLLSKNKKVFIISEEKLLSKIIKEKKLKYQQVINPKNFQSFITKLKVKKFIIDNLSCSILNQKIIESKFQIVERKDPCYKLKSIKNSVEINNTIKAHVEDGLALTRFIFWIKNSNKIKLLKSMQKISYRNLE